VQVGVLIDNQIKRAKIEAEQNFKVEMSKMRKELHGVQVFTEQQGKVIAALSKDLGGVAQELTRVNGQLATLQAQIVQHRQVTSTVQHALDRGIKQLLDMDKRIMSVGGPPSSGMMRGFPGQLGAEFEHQIGLGAAGNLPRNRTRKKKDGPKSLRAEAPEFIPAGPATDPVDEGPDTEEA